MLKSYVLTAWRNMLRHRAFTVINITGLSVSMSVCIGIIMLMADQLSYDRYNTKRERIFRVNSNPVGPKGEHHPMSATTTLPLKYELEHDFSGVEKAVRLIRGFGNNWIETGQENINIPVAGYFADPEVLDMFEYPLEHGDARTALVEPHSVVLTKTAAVKLFKQPNPVGETLAVGDLGLFKVTGVLRDGLKTHIAFDALASLSTLATLESRQLPASMLEDWFNFNSGWVYVMLNPETPPAELINSLKQTERRHFQSLRDPETQWKISYSIQPLTDITPGPIIGNAIGPFMPWPFVYFFGALALIITATACFNFTNLSIARAFSRAKEIGVRKVTGALRTQIITQFVTEAVLISLLSLIGGYAILFAVLKPLVLELGFAKMLRWDMDHGPLVHGCVVLFAILTGLATGLFPALVMSRFQPAAVLKRLGQVKLISNLGLRKFLLVTQFSFSLIFILTVLTVFDQLHTYLGTDHGFVLENQIVVQLNGVDASQFKTALATAPGIVSVSASSHIPAAGVSYGSRFKQSLTDADWMSLSYFSVDEDYLENMGLTLLAGRFFNTHDGPSKANFVVIDENTVKALGVSISDAPGLTLIDQRDSVSRQIIGVIKNYNHQLLMEHVEPLILIYQPSEFRILQVSYTGDFTQAAARIRNAWTRLYPTLQVDFKELAGEVHKIYDLFFGDIVRVLTVVATLAIVISCMGLLGMAAYETETRMKEVAIRRVLGGSSGSIIVLLSKGFLRMLAIAALIALPLAWFGNNLWLEMLANHTTIGPLILASGLLMLLTLGCVTIVSQTIRAVHSNPVNNLKNE